MAKDDRRLTDLDRSKAGLQDDHDPSDPAQKSANKPHGVEPKKDDLGFPKDDESKWG